MDKTNSNISRIQEALYDMPTLGHKAAILAFQIETFVRDVAKDTGTADSRPRGMNWREGAEDASAESLLIAAEDLYNLADLWDRG